MIDERHLTITMRQLGRVLQALDGLRDTVLEKNPQLYALMSESYLDLIGKLREEILEMLPSAELIPPPNSAVVAVGPVPPVPAGIETVH